jgi:hypothetical protein
LTNQETATSAKTIALPTPTHPKAALVLVKANKMDRHFTEFWVQHLQERRAKDVEANRFQLPGAPEDVKH